MSDKNKWESSIPWVICLITFFIFYPFAFVGVDAHHDGVILKPALDVLAGKIIFRDTFNQYGALSSYLQAVFLGIFGSSLKVLKISNIFMYALSSALLFKCWRVFLPLSLSILSWVIWLLFAPFYDPKWIMLPWPSVQALFFQSVTLYFLILSFKGYLAEREAQGVRGFELYSFFAGIGSALTFLCRQPVGVFALLAVASTYVMGFLVPGLRRKSFRCLVSSILGFCAIIGLFFVFLMINHAVNDWYFQTVKWPQIWVSRLGTNLGRISADLFIGKENGIRILTFILFLFLPFQLNRWFKPKLKKNGAQIGLLLTGYYLILFVFVAQSEWEWGGAFNYPGGWPSAIPIGVIIFFIVQFFRVFLSQKNTGQPDSRNDRDSHLVLVSLAVSLMSLGSWLQYYPVSCVRHIYWSISPAIGLFVYAVYLLSGKKTAPVSIVFILLFGSSFLTRAEVAKANLDRDLVTLKGLPVLEGMKVPALEAEDWQKFIQAVSNYPNKNTPLLLEGEDPLYTTLVSNRSNPGPIFMNWGISTVDEIQRRTQFIAENLPLIFVQKERREYLNEVIQRFGYSTLLRVKSGELLAVKKSMKE